MPKIAYIERTFSPASLAIIEQANDICDRYAERGLDLTLRQLYYRFVAQDLIANKQSEYKRLGSIINDARLAGLIDWSRIEDRTRGVETPAAWEDPSDIVAAVATQFAVDKWSDQPYRVEVWVEKDALVGIIEAACKPLNVPYLSCRGYTSQSEMWRAAQRLLRWIDQDQTPYIIHLGDHDPSGKDMSRDIQDRLELFTGGRVKFQRIALNMDQVDQYKPPPNPTKITDSRANAYMAEFGGRSWELDALDPEVLSDLITDAVEEVRDPDLYAERVTEEREGRKQLATISRRFEDVVSYLEAE